MEKTTFVIGHVNPDTDSIAASIGYAWLLRERDGVDVVPARAGAMNIQSLWVLERLGLDSPRLLSDASPRIETVARRVEPTLPETPLREAWIIANRTGGVAPIVKDDGTPYGLITGLTLFSFLSEIIGPHPRRQEMRIADVLDVPSHEATDIGVPRFPANGRIRDTLPRIFREERNHFLVVDDAGKYLGVCRQRDLLNPPRLRIIMVDHNEAEQALGALEEADLIETEEQLVQHCQHLGTISEIPDPGKIVQLLEDYSTKKKVMKRARRLGASHIVWLNKNKAGYIAGAYRCPENE